MDDIKELNTKSNLTQEQKEEADKKFHIGEYVIPDHAFQDRVVDILLEGEGNFIYEGGQDNGNKNKRGKTVQNATRKKYYDSLKDPVKKREVANALAEGKWWDVNSNSWREDTASAWIKKNVENMVKDEWSKSQAKQSKDTAANAVKTAMADKSADTSNSSNNSQADKNKNTVKSGTENANDLQKQSQQQRDEVQEQLLKTTVEPRAWYWQYVDDMVADMDPSKQKGAAKALYTQYLLSNLANLFYRTGDAGSIMAGQTPLNKREISSVEKFADQKIKDYLSQVEKLDDRRLESRIDRDKKYQEFLQSEELKALQSSFYDIDKDYQRNEANLKIDKLKYVGQRMGKDKLKNLEASLNNALLYSNDVKGTFDAVLGSLGVEAVDKVTSEFSKNRKKGMNVGSALSATMKALF